MARSSRIRLFGAEHSGSAFAGPTPRKPVNAANARVVKNLAFDMVPSLSIQVGRAKPGRGSKLSHLPGTPRAHADGQKQGGEDLRAAEPKKAAAGGAEVRLKVVKHLSLSMSYKNTGPVCPQTTPQVRARPASLIFPA